MKKIILIVPGFIADTYSEIEASFVELCTEPDDKLHYLWLVPEVGFKYTRFAKAESKAKLSEPIYVSHLRERKIPYCVGNIYRYNVLKNIWLFHRIFRDYRIGAVYTHFGFERFWAMLLGKLWGKATIWNVHWHSLGTRYRLPKRIFYALFVDYFISVSDFIAKTLPHLGRKYTVPNSIRVDLNSGTMSSQQKALVRSELGVPGKGPIILMVAAFTRQKRHMLALSICERVIAERKGVVFVFLGDGPERERIVRKIGEKQLQDYFYLPGHVDNVSEYYSIADTCMFTAYDDAAPYAVLEAMRWALPIVAFSSGGPAEVIRNGETGVLVKEGDVDLYVEELIALIDDGARLAEMKKKAREVVQREYDRDVWKEKMRSVLRDIVASDQ